MAVSLGQQRGIALIGRPLELSIQAVLGAQKDLTQLCLDADVSYGDSKLDKSKVRITTEKSAETPQGMTIFVRSLAVVDEPVVTILLRMGCQQKTERRYVVLADFVPDVIDPVQTAQANGRLGPAIPLPATLRSESLRALATASPLSTSRIGRPVSTTLSGNAVGRSGVRIETPSAQRAAKPQVSKTREKNQPRLKLESVDLTMERFPSLKSSYDLLRTPASSEPERSVAAALWRALSAQPQDLLRDAEKLQALEVSMVSLRAQSQKNQLTITELNGQIQKAQADRFFNPLVYMLGLLLVLALAALTYLWSRRSFTAKNNADELPWWSKNKPLKKGWANSRGEIGAFWPVDRSKLKRSSSDSSLDRELGLNQSAFTEVNHLSELGDTDLGTGRARKVRPDFAMSLSQSSRAIKVEELFDVQQQADFFVSLGQHEQAIQVLRNHVGENVRTSALVYLDLFNLYHQLQRQADYESLRKDFNQHFNAEVPEFDLYTDAGPGLEAYETALTRIETLWPSPKVLEIIEESIFRGPDANAVPFGLEAYRELLLLFSIAKEIISTTSGNEETSLNNNFSEPWLIGTEPSPLKFVATSIQPLSASAADIGQPEIMSGVNSELPKASPRLGLDINLNELSGESENLSSNVESDSHFFAQFASKSEGSSSALPVAIVPVSKPSSAFDSLPEIGLFDSYGNFTGKQKPGKLDS